MPGEMTCSVARAVTKNLRIIPTPVGKKVSVFLQPVWVGNEMRR